MYRIKATIIEADPDLFGEEPLDREMWSYPTLAEAQAGYDLARSMYADLGLRLISAVIVDDNGNTYPVEVSL